MTDPQATESKRQPGPDLVPAKAHDDRAQRVAISLVIPWVNDLDLLLPGLESLEHQSGPPPAEIIVVTRRGIEDQERLRAWHPAVPLLAAPSDTPITTVRSLGLREARGEVVAITEDHCVPRADWFAAIERGMQRENCAVVGGPVENAANSRLRDWAAFLTEYAGAILPAPGIYRIQPLPGNNVANWCELVPGLCAALERRLWKSFYHERLTKRGLALTFVPGRLVYHRRPFNFGYFISQLYHLCRSFTGMRRQSLSVIRRQVYGAGCVLLSPLPLFRASRTLQRKRRLVGRYLVCLPLVVIDGVVGTFGEKLGFFLVGADSLVRVE